MKKNASTPEAIAGQCLSRLKAKADPKNAAGFQRYFKEAVAAYGVSSAGVREIADDLFRSIKAEWSVVEAMRLCDILYPEPEIEAKSVATLILARFHDNFPKTLFSRIKTWLASNFLDNWASVDVLCPDVVGALIQKYPGLEKQIKPWAGHDNRWVKRAAAVSFVKLAKKEKYAEAIYTIAESLFPVDDDLVQKANGWLLRETGKCDKKRLEMFLLKHGPAVPRTTLRYAIERFETKKRKELLLKTRAY